MKLRTRTFVSTTAGAVIALVVVAVLVALLERRSLTARIEGDLAARTRLAAELLSSRPVSDSLDAEADAIARLTGARVTFIDAAGAVTGDSEVADADLAAVENHADRPEVVEARAAGFGRSRRYSETADVDMVYAAAPVRDSPIAIVRLALPLVSVREQLQPIWTTSLLALGAGLIAALLLSWTTSHWLTRRVRDIADVARRYARGDLSRPTREFGDDEIGQVARVLDDSVQELGRRLDDSRRTHARMEAILAGMFEGVVLVNSAGRLLVANAAARAMLKIPADPGGVQGRQPLEIENRHYLEIIRNPDVGALLGQSLREGRPAQGEVTLGRRVFTARTSPVSAVEGPSTALRAGGAVLVLHDITDLRRADQIRRDFVANVSHELRTPLTAVRGYVEALQDSAGPGEAERNFLEIISRHTLRMERLVNDLLRLARLDAGQEAVDSSAVDVAALIDGIESELEPHIAARRMTVVRDIARDAARIHVDTVKLHDALRNLVENAVHYGAEGTAVDVAVRRDGRDVILEIADRGPGIPPGDLERVFERFYRVDRARTRDPGGTGLGLAIVKHLIGLHGGTVTAGNRTGGGAVFTVRLPRAVSIYPPNSAEAPQ